MHLQTAGCAWCCVSSNIQAAPAFFVWVPLLPQVVVDTAVFGPAHVAGAGPPTACSAAAAANAKAQLPVRATRHFQPRQGQHAERCLSGDADPGAGYFSYMTVLEGGGLPEIAAKLRRDFWPTFSAELAVWPVVQVGWAGLNGAVGLSRRP